jgi:dolichol-phosphate mannosyltransferase
MTARPRKNKGQTGSALSVVVPLYNEEANVPLLYRAIRRSLRGIDGSAELIFVDDGSTDGTRHAVRRLAERDPRLKAIFFRRNFGQSAAMAAGFRASRGRRVVTLDGDLQNDPEDIPMLLRTLGEGFDVVSGWRKNRKDKLFMRRIPSRLANWLICSLTGVRLHDTGCALKAFRREVVERIRLYGELHRFLPALARVEGARIAEMPVRHHPRRYGCSKYNLSRIFRVLMDLSSLNLFLKYLKNPLRFFGKLGIGFFAFAVLGTVWIVWQAAVRNLPFADLNVVATLVFLLWSVGFQFVFMGLVASLVVRTGVRRGGALTPLTRLSGRAKP